MQQEPRRSRIYVRCGVCGEFIHEYRVIGDTKIEFPDTNIQCQYCRKRSIIDEVYQNWNAFVGRIVTIPVAGGSKLPPPTIVDGLPVNPSGREIPCVYVLEHSAEPGAHPPDFSDIRIT